MTRACLECGKRLDAFPKPIIARVMPSNGGDDASTACHGRPGRSAEFCCRECRSAFNNRRASRGAELYDLYMTARFDRPLAAKLKVWGWLARLATAYRDDDRREREGRPSWRHPREIAERRPYITAPILDRGRAA